MNNDHVLRPFARPRTPPPPGLMHVRIPIGYKPVLLVCVHERSGEIGVLTDEPGARGDASAIAHLERAMQWLRMRRNRQ